MLDTGLLSAATGLDIKTFYEGSSLVFKEFKGAITEQFVLQELKTLDRLPVYYWGRDEGKSEVDFVVQWQNELIPIEVKSGIHKKSKSLEIYRGLYNPARAIRTTLNNFGMADALYSIPLYMIASFGKNITVSPSVLNNSTTELTSIPWALTPRISAKSADEIAPPTQPF